MAGLNQKTGLYDKPIRQYTDKELDVSLGWFEWYHQCHRKDYDLVKEEITRRKTAYLPNE